MRKLPQKAPSTVSRARFEAFSILMEVERGQAYADDLLRGARVSALSVQDRNLCTALVLGVLRWQIRLDAVIRSFLSKPNAKLDAAIRIALRLGAFQLQWMDRIPDHAAISESVSLAKLAGHQHASRMVNAVLRMVAGTAKPDLAFTASNAAELAAASAHPEWLVERWALNYGLETAQAICANGQRQPELEVRLENAEAEAELTATGVTLARGAILHAARRVLSGDVSATEAFKTGRVRIQEEGSQLIAELAGHDKKILDACAAPGGKTLILAELNPQATITACEVSLARFEALKARITATPYATQIQLLYADATQLPDSETYDLVLVDVPCSGTGTMGRNPEIRHRLKPEDLTRHHERQCALLRSALRVGTRRVVYSTCSLEPEENALVVAEVLATNTEWRQAPVSEALRELLERERLTAEAAESFGAAVAADGSLTILPGSLGPDIQTDGFFIAVLERQA